VTERTYSVGIVGCGGMGRSHAKQYQRHDRTDIVAAAELNADTRSEFAEEFDVPATYKDHSAMLADADLDVLSICTWHSTHAEIVVSAAEGGVDGIICEKPMATSLGEGEDMLTATDRNDVKLAVSTQRRFDPVHETARDLIGDGAIGTPRSVTAQKGGGVLNWGTHIVDITRYILGDPDYEWVMGQVERRTDRYERGLEVEDRCVGQVCFEDGTRMTYEGDMPVPDFDDVTIHISGTDGVMELELGSSVTVVSDGGTNEYAPTSELSDRAAFLAAFVEWLDGDRTDHRCSGPRSGRVVEILMALYESARIRGVVERPLQTRANPLKRMIESGDLPVEYPGKYDIRIPYESVRDEE